MKSIIDELYYGNITPNERSFQKGSEYDRALRSVVKCQDELIPLLSDKGKELIEEYSRAQGNVTSISCCDMWKKGFILGLRIGIEVMTEQDEV